MDNERNRFASLLDSIVEGAEQGAFIGKCIIGIPGIVVGGFIGGIVNGLRTLVVKPLAKLIDL